MILNWNVPFLKMLYFNWVTNNIICRSLMQYSIRLSHCARFFKYILQSLVFTAISQSTTKNPCRAFRVRFKTYIHTVPQNARGNWGYYTHHTYRDHVSKVYTANFLLMASRAHEENVTAYKTAQTRNMMNVHEPKRSTTSFIFLFSCRLRLRLYYVQRTARAKSTSASTD